LGESQVVNGFVGDGTGDDVAAADVDADVGGGLAFGDFEDFAGELVARAEFHVGCSFGDSPLSTLNGRSRPD